MFAGVRRRQPLESRGMAAAQLAAARLETRPASANLPPRRRHETGPCGDPALATLLSGNLAEFADRPVRIPTGPARNAGQAAIDHEQRVKRRTFNLAGEP